MDSTITAVAPTPSVLTRPEGVTVSEAAPPAPPVLNAVWSAAVPPEPASPPVALTRTARKACPTVETVDDRVRATGPASPPPPKFVRASPPFPPME
ncbi:hypothetical protein MKK84_34850 [Methylobacterium sp. E-065]|nr:hypothetical protein [Methylobacterium sp. E-065]